MQVIRRAAFLRSFRFNAIALYKGVLVFILTATAALVTFSLLVAIAVLPFGGPRAILAPPAWLTPLFGEMDLVNAFLTIAFGPSFGVSLIAAALTTLVMLRIYPWLHRGVSDLFDGQHDDAFALVEKVHSHLAATTAPQALLPTIPAAIAQSLRLPYVAIATQDGDELLESSFGVPPPGATIQQLPLRYQDSKIGELNVSARRAGDSLSPSDLKVLGDLAQQVAITLYAARMTVDLQHSRTRLVTAREEERRRIRRDLHDGLGPTLANFAMRLEQAYDNLPPGAEESAALLAALTVEAQNMIADVRRLVYQLRPPDLDEYGLVSALREYLHRVTPKGTVVTLDAPQGSLTLPAAVEVAAYRIVQEAVNNAVKHARAGAIIVKLALLPSPVQPALLWLEISDNGVGLAADHPVGIGLLSMQERAEELGGVFTIQSNEEGGTRIAAQLPIA